MPTLKPFPTIPRTASSIYPYRLGQLEGLVESYLRGFIKNKRAFEREYKALLAQHAAEDAAPLRCYSDHDEDIRTKGSCDYCHSSEPQGSDPAAVASGPAPRRCGCEIQLDRRCEHER